MSKREMKEWLASIDAELAENEPVLYKWSQDDSLLTYSQNIINDLKRSWAKGWKEVLLELIVHLFVFVMCGLGVQMFGFIIDGPASAGEPPPQFFSEFDLTPLGIVWFLIKGLLAFLIAGAVVAIVFTGKAHHFRITEKGIHHVTWENYPELGHMMVKLILLISMPIVIIIAIIGGPMVFVGAGGAALGVFGIYASMGERAKRHDFAAWEDNENDRPLRFWVIDPTQVDFRDIEFDCRYVMPVNDLLAFINQRRTKPIEAKGSKVFN